MFEVLVSLPKQAMDTKHVLLNKCKWNVVSWTFLEYLYITLHYFKVLIFSLFLRSNSSDQVLLASVLLCFYYNKESLTRHIN